MLLALQQHPVSFQAINARADKLYQLFKLFIETEQRSLAILGLFILFQHIFHVHRLRTSVGL